MICLRWASGSGWRWCHKKNPQLVWDAYYYYCQCQKRWQGQGGGTGCRGGWLPHQALQCGGAIGTGAGGEEVHLTNMEYKLLARNSGKVLTYKYLLRQVWGSALESDMASLRGGMVSLRKKLAKSSGRQYLQTHVGIGYRLIWPMWKHWKNFANIISIVFGSITYSYKLIIL